MITKDKKWEMTSIKYTFADNHPPTSKRVVDLHAQPDEFLRFHRYECHLALQSPELYRDALIAQLHPRASDHRLLEHLLPWLAEQEKDCADRPIQDYMASPHYHPRGLIRLAQRAMTSPREREKMRYEHWPEVVERALRALMREAIYQILHLLVYETLDRNTLAFGAVSNRSIFDSICERSAANKRFFWTVVSVAEPFLNLQRESLLALFWDEFTHRKLYHLVEELSRPSGRKGIKPEEGLATMLSDFFLDRAVCREWRKLHTDIRPAP